MSYRGRGRGGGYNNNYNNYNHGNRNQYSSGSHQQNVDAFVSANQYPIEIMGWNGASLTECINFISRKCKVIVSNYSVDSNTGVLKGYVKNESQANTLMDWSGVKFAGQPLRFSKGVSSLSNQMGGASGGSNSTIETITQFLRSRYQPELKMLNLSNVKQDPNLHAQGFFGSISVTSKFFPALMKVADDLKLDVVSIDLSNNELQDLQTLTSMAQTFPKLQNLSLQNNNFSRIKVFETWRHKLNFLRELILFNNPIVQTNNPTEIQNIKLELMKSFPRLIVLNGEILRNEQALDANLSFPFPPQQSMFFQDDDARNLATNFIANYIKLWDSNRAELMILYQNESQFSMQVDSSHPYLIDNSNSTDFGYYLTNSRNLTRVSSVKARMDKLAIGQEQIYKSFQKLPKTRHALFDKPDLFSMETYKFPSLNGIMITLHGSFEETAQPEVDPNTSSTPSGPRGGSRYHSAPKHKKIPLSKKSFDRTFVVIPGPNGSMIVASDSLMVRPYTTKFPWDARAASAAPLNPASAANPATATATPTPPPLQPQHPQPQVGIPGGVTPAIQVVSPTPTAADLPPEVKARFNQVQQEVLVKVLLETKLNINYGLMLLEQSNWDYQQASVNFKNSAASLPRDAFV
ncbi:mRNA export factor MEX67 [Candida viswanathii]|uniref:mRNA export factor MEX67 n=1 Tax=Candida viswanathii TaxID=5486 RepID=A0A367Y1Z9_9ASCO|nr:mRNA export factor MEX67 [Candida viswanathii]